MTVDGLPTTGELLELPIDTLPEGVVEIAERIAGCAVGMTSAARAA